MEKINIGKKLEKLRIEKGITQKELSSILYVSSSTISLWEKDKNYPDLEILSRICNYYQISCDELIVNKRTINFENDYVFNQENISFCLATFRRKKGIGQKELGYRYGISVQAVSKWENGQSLPDINILFDLLNLYDSSFDFLLRYGQVSKEVSKPNKYKKPFIIGTSIFALLLVSISAAVIGILANSSKDDSVHVSTYSGLLDAIAQHNDEYSTIVLDDDIIVDSSFETIKSFYATLDGKGHSITNVDKPLFYTIMPEGRIKNIHLDVNIMYTYSLGNYVGGLSILNHGSISYMYLTGNINLASQLYVGGLVGFNYGTIRNCSNFASLVCKDYVGGIAGYNQGIISFSVNNGELRSIGSVVDGENISHYGSICGFTLDSFLLNGCATTYSSGVDEVYLYGDRQGTVDFSFTALVTKDNIDYVLDNWLNYDVNNNDIVENGIVVNRDENVWFDNRGTWVAKEDKPQLKLFENLFI